MLDEKALRRPGFVEGVRVVLGDGQEWTIPAGVFSLESNEAGIGRRLTDPEIELLCGSAFDEPGVFVETLTGMAGRLLAVNYDLRPFDYATLLEYEGGSESSAEMWQAVAAAASGRNDAERTYARWLRDAIASNGADAEGFTLAKAANLAGLFVSQGRATPAHQWVVDAMAKRDAERLEGMF